jgi:hypothetical protein
MRRPSRSSHVVRVKDIPNLLVRLMQWKPVSSSWRTLVPMICARWISDRLPSSIAQLANVCRQS